MDLKVVVKQMLEKGTSPEAVRANLVELGVQDPDKIIQEVIASQKPVEKKVESVVPQGKPGLTDLDKLEARKSEGILPVEEPPKPVEKVEKKSASLFRTPVVERKPEKKIEEKSEKKVIEEKPVLKKQEPIIEKPIVEKEVELSPITVTKISANGEKEVSLGDLINKKKDLMQSVSNVDYDELEEKLDETIALLKALKELNKDILETERKVLLRLK
ncbi:MAG: hypothetical protein ABH803_01285 [Candidatus Micrarchaeota archaeon]